MEVLQTWDGQEDTHTLESIRDGWDDGKERKVRGADIREVDVHILDKAPIRVHVEVWNGLEDGPRKVHVEEGQMDLENTRVAKQQKGPGTARVVGQQKDRANVRVEDLE